MAICINWKIYIFYQCFNNDEKKVVKIKKMILITKTPKKVIGLEGFNIKITKQELI